MPLILTDLHSRARLSQGGGVQRIIPAAVASPCSEAELAEVIAWAVGEGQAITPRGAGSSMSGGSIGPGLALDLTGFEPGNLVIELDADGLAGSVEASTAVSLGEIQAHAGRIGLRLGPDPSSAAWATVGGVMGTNAAGPRSYRLGSIDRWVESLELHTTDGSLQLTRGVASNPDHPAVRRFVTNALPVLDAHRAAVESRWPRTRKNTAGYALTRYWQSGDLIDLVIGAEGTLGVVSRARLRLERIPALSASIRVALADRSSIATAVNAIATAQPTTIELMDSSLMRLVADLTSDNDAQLLRTAAALLLVDVEAEDVDALRHRVEQVRSIAAPLAMEVRTATDPDQAAALWNARHHASSAIAASVGRTPGRHSLQLVEDGCVPVERLGDYLDAIDRACEAAAVEHVKFGHAGDGHVHVNLIADTSVPDWRDRLRAVFDQVTAAQLRLGGTPAGEHGAGRLRTPVLERFLGAEAMECFAAVKRAFDPAGIFNPGVILSDGRDPLDSLRIGPDAAPLPDEIGAWLERVERERLWGQRETGNWKLET